MLIERTIIILGFRHSGLVLAKGNRCPTLRVRHKQCPSLTNAITPGSDVRTFQSAICLVGSILCLLRQFTLSTHRLLAVLISVVEIGDVDAQTQKTSDESGQTSFKPPCELMVSDSIHQIGNCHQQQDAEEVVRHLDVVTEDLQTCEDTRYQNTPQIPASIAEHHTRDGGWYEAQCQQFPDVTSGNDDEIIAGESPQHCTEGCHPRTEVECTQQDVEAQQHHEHITGNLRQTQLVYFFHCGQRISAIVRRRHLIGGHTRE